MKTKKSLGQNFFINKNLSKQIVESALKEKPDIMPCAIVFLSRISQANDDFHDKQVKSL